MVPRRYGAYLSEDKVVALVAPHSNTHELINSWLAYYWIHPSSVSMTHSGGWLTISKVPPPQANTLLGASYQVYRHTEADPIILHTTSYALPTVLHEYGETVDDVLQFATLLQTLRLVPNGTTPPSIIAPTDLCWSYNTETYKPRATRANMPCIAGYLQQFASQSDLITPFMRRFRPDSYMRKPRSHLLLSAGVSTIRIFPHPLLPVSVYVTYTYTRTGQP